MAALKDRALFDQAHDGLARGTNGIWHGRWIERRGKSRRRVGELYDERNQDHWDGDGSRAARIGSYYVAGIRNSVHRRGDLITPDRQSGTGI
jgi:hypothetical protein